MKQRGYFSLIQYVPHLGRAEAANVGVVVIAEGQPPAVLLAESNDGPKRRFGAEQVSERHLEAAKRALRAQLESYLGSSSSRDALTAFARSAGNALQLTPPRAYAVEDVSAAARQLLDELVEVTPVHRSRVLKPRLAPLVDSLERDAVPIERGAILVVPVSEEEIKSDFAYLNGAKNFVYAQGFSEEKRAATELAEQLGYRGRIAFEKSADRPVRDKLVVVAGFSGGKQRDLVTRVLTEFSVEVIQEPDLEDFGRRVKREAKRPQIDLLS